MGLFGKKMTPDSQDEQDGQQAEQATLPSEGALRNLVRRLQAGNSQGGKLTLIQRGNAMNHQTERNVNGSVETDSGVVDQNHPLFKDVAELYTTSMSQDIDAWQTLVITADEHTVQVDYDYASAPHKTETYRLDDAQPAERQIAADAHASQTNAAHATTTQNPVSHDSSNTTSHGVAAQGQEETPVAPRSSDAVATAAGAGVGSGAVAAAAQGRREEGQPVHNPNPATTENQSNAETPVATPDTQQQPVAQEHTSVAQERPEPPRVEQRRSELRRSVAPGEPTSAETSTDVPDSVTTAPAEHMNSQELPDHVDHDEWREDTAARSGVRATGPAAAAAAAGAGAASRTGSGVGNDFTAPSVARGADVAPSYKGEETAVPSADRLAEGNKVLTEADVVNRLASAQKRLFGAGGTALDVSTVLIRIRTLGSYYDALTHVRQGGFWDQRGTFDLVPEEDLKVQELKEESYVEGEGAPVAIMFRFRPGIPPEVSFDYTDEEAFVRYEERLPSQNYVEELRMYPRTGANISQHMNDALQDWNY